MRPVADRFTLLKTVVSATGRATFAAGSLMPPNGASSVPVALAAENEEFQTVETPDFVIPDRAVGPFL